VTGEVVALHRAREALADRGAGDIDDLARLEVVHLENSAPVHVGVFLRGGQAELDQRLARSDVRLGVMAGDGLADSSCGRRSDPYVTCTAE
jgi:hypothetical protein